jgi:excisionase family DNA binding protein
MREQSLGSVGVTGHRGFLRVDEAAVILGISRSAAYEQANVWLATGGRSGLPVVRLGRSLRVPRAAIERLLLVGADPAEEA